MVTPVSGYLSYQSTLPVPVLELPVAGRLRTLGLLLLATILLLEDQGSNSFLYLGEVDFARSSFSVPAGLS
jgi:hypothetical protein